MFELVSMQKDIDHNVFVKLELIDSFQRFI